MLKEENVDARDIGEQRNAVFNGYARA